MTNACAWFNAALRPQKPQGSLGRGAHGGHLDFHTAPELDIWLQARHGHMYVPILNSALLSPGSNRPRKARLTPEAQSVFNPVFFKSRLQFTRPTPSSAPIIGPDHVLHEAGRSKRSDQRQHMRDRHEGVQISSEEKGRRRRRNRKRDGHVMMALFTAYQLENNPSLSLERAG